MCGFAPMHMAGRVCLFPVMYLFFTAACTSRPGKKRRGGGGGGGGGGRGKRYLHLRPLLFRHNAATSLNWKAAGCKYNFKFNFLDISSSHMGKSRQSAFEVCILCTYI